MPKVTSQSPTTTFPLRRVLNRSIGSLISPGLFRNSPPRLVAPLTSGTRAIVMLALLASGSIAADASTVVFSEDFTTSTGTAFDTSGAIGTSTVWNVTPSGADWGAKIDTGKLTLTNDAGATANANGWVSATTSTSLFSSPYNSTLSLNATAVTWTFNIEQIRADPAGYAAGSYGAAFILGGTSASAGTTGNGYAIVYGQSGTTDPVRLVSFAGGIQGTLTNIITATAPLADVGAEFLSLGVTYDPSTNGWTLLGRNDGATAFADPTTGTLSVLGSATNTTFTGTSLGFLGGYWQGSTAATQTAQFDNIKLSLADAVVTSDFIFWDTNGTTAGSGNAGGNWSSASWNSVADGTGSTSTFTDTKTPTFAAGTDGVGTYTVTVDTTVNANGLTFQEGNVTLAHGTNGVLTLTGASINVATGATATISEIIGGSVGLIKDGAGTLTLSGANGYSGTTTVNNGILSISSDGNLGNTANGITLGGGTLQTTASISLNAGRATNGAGTLDVAPGTTLTFNGTVGATTPGALTLTNTGTVVFANATTNSTTGLIINAATTISDTGIKLIIAGDVTTAQASGEVIISGTGLDFGATSLARNYTVADGTSSTDTDLLISAPVTSTGAASYLQKRGAGTLELTGNNSGLVGMQIGSQGSSPLVGGRVLVNNNLAIGAGQLRANIGTLEASTSLTALTGGAFANSISVGGRTTGFFTFAGADMEFTGGLTFFRATGTAAGELRFNVNNSTTISGLGVATTGSGGAGGVTVGGTGKLVLAGNNTAITETFTTSDSLNLVVTGTINGVITSGTSTLSGSGTVGALTVQSGATVSPGVGLGKLTAGATSLLAGGAYKFELKTDGSTGTAGVDWDQLALGTLDLSTLNPSTFTIKLQTLDGTGANGLLASWDGSSDHTWLQIATTAGVTGFSSSDFNIDTTGFANLFPGQFSVLLDGDGTSLDLQYSHIPEPSAFLSLGLGLVGLMTLRRFRRLA